MKRPYKKPLTTVFRMQPQQMICQSLPYTEQPGDPSQPILSRRSRDVWDEEEEE
jgi:hypothetical protein